ADTELFREFGRRHGIDLYWQPGGPGTVAPIDGPARPLGYRLDRFDVTLEFAPPGLVQSNAAVDAAIVETAVEAAALDGSERVLDLFSGIGNFSLPLARSAAEVLGVEGDAGLVARAAANARGNGIPNARFVTADLNERGFGFYREPWDVVVLDPPRTGA